jgi:thiamine transport system permease protein
MFEADILQTFYFTLFQAALSTLLSLLVGIFIAWSLVHQRDFWAGRAGRVVLSVSIVLPVIIVAFGLIGIYGRNGWLNQAAQSLFGFSFGAYLYGLFGILLAHVYLNASYAAVTLTGAFEMIPLEQYKLSGSLGLSQWQRFRYVEYPAVRSTLYRTASTIFLLCFTSFGVVLLLGGQPRYNTLQVAIYEALRIDFDIPRTLHLSLLQLAVSSLLVVAVSFVTGKTANIKQASVAIPWQEGGMVALFQKSVILLFLLFFLLPLAEIVCEAFVDDLFSVMGEPLFQKALLTSLLIAAISSVLSIVVSLAIASFQLMFLNRRDLIAKLLYGATAAVSNIYLAVPSLVMGFGLFLYIQRYDLDMNRWGFAAVVFSNVLLSLPFATANLSPKMEQVSQRYRKLTVSLGMGAVKRFVMVYLPYLLPSIGFVWALSFCFSLGDLGIIALFGSDELVTLPWYLYELMGSYRTHQAASVALILLLLVVSIFIFIPKMVGKLHADNR